MCGKDNQNSSAGYCSIAFPDFISLYFLSLGQHHNNYSIDTRSTWISHFLLDSHRFALAEPAGKGHVR